MVLLLWRPEAPNGFCTPQQWSRFLVSLISMPIYNPFFSMCSKHRCSFHLLQPAKWHLGFESQWSFPFFFSTMTRNEVLQAIFLPSALLRESLMLILRAVCSMSAGVWWTALLLVCKEEESYSPADACSDWMHFRMYFLSASDRICSRQTCSDRRCHFCSSHILEHITPRVWHITAVYLICLPHKQWKTLHAALSTAQLSGTCQASLHF